MNGLEAAEELERQFISGDMDVGDLCSKLDNLADKGNYEKVRGVELSKLVTNT